MRVYEILPFGREATQALATSLLRKSSLPYCLLISEALIAVATASTSLSFSRSTENYRVKLDIGHI